MIVFTNGTQCTYGYYIEVQFVDDTGNAIDISAASVKQIVFVPPTGSPVVKTAAFTNTGTDGKIRYLVDIGLFLVNGKWNCYGVVDSTGVLGKATTNQEINVYTKPGLSLT